MNIAAILKLKGSAVISITPESTVPDIASLITSRKIGAVIVLAEDGSLAGIVSERDVVRAIAQKGAAALQLTAEAIMTKKVTTATPATTVDQAMATMDHGYFRHLPVVDGGALVGVISVRDVVRGYIQEQANEVDDLRSYVLRGSQEGGLR